MSRLGKKPIEIPSGLTVEVSDNSVTVKNDKSSLFKELPRDIKIEKKEKEIVVSPMHNTKRCMALWGLSRTLIANMVEGLTKGFSKKLVFEGVGYRASLEGNDLVLLMGFSHPVRVPAPPGIEFTVEKSTILVSGADKELVGQTAARIRKVKPVEPYKGKGIRYENEIVRRKAGKKAVAATA